jgi:hypothetical protein
MLFDTGSGSSSLWTALSAVEAKRIVFGNAFAGDTTAARDGLAPIGATGVGGDLEDRRRRELTNASVATHAVIVPFAHRLLNSLAVVWTAAAGRRMTLRWHASCSDTRTIADLVRQLPSDVHYVRRQANVAAAVVSLAQNGQHTAAPSAGSGGAAGASSRTARVATPATVANPLTAIATPATAATLTSATDASACPVPVIRAVVRVYVHFIG